MQVRLSVKHALLLLLISTSCGPQDGTAPARSGGGQDAKRDGRSISLIDHKRWVSITSAAEDPGWAHRPEQIDCSGWYQEGETLEVQTGYCNYFSAQQPIQAVVPKSSKIAIVLYHAQLTAITPAKAHVAVYLGSDLIWEKQISIPHMAQSISETVTVTKSYALDTPLTFHLHNHGYNSWNLVSIYRDRSGTD